jgi:ribosomal protein S21
MACNIRVRDKRGFEQMLRVFRRESCNVLQEIKARRFYESSSEKRRRERRHRKRGGRTKLYDFKRSGSHDKQERRLR